MALLTCGHVSKLKVHTGKYFGSFDACFKVMINYLKFLFLVWTESFPNSQLITLSLKTSSKPILGLIVEVANIYMLLVKFLNEIVIAATAPHTPRPRNSAISYRVFLL